MSDTDSPIIIGTVKVTDTRYWIEDDGDGGSMQVHRHTDENGCPEWHDVSTFECETVEEAAERIRDAGCTEDAGSWYCDPDGSHTVDYSTGERSEPAAFLEGFSEADEARIAELVAR